MWYAMTEMQMADGCLKFAGYFKNWVGRNSWVISGWLELHTKLFQPIQVANEVMLGLGPALLQNLKIVSSLSWAFAFFLQHCFDLISIFDVFLHQVPLSTQGPTGLRPVQTWNLGNFKVCSLFLERWIMIIESLLINDHSKEYSESCLASWLLCLIILVIVCNRFCASIWTTKHPFTCGRTKMTWFGWGQQLTKA